MATKRPTVPNQVNVITLKSAKEWHRAFKDQMKKGFRKGDIPLSILIPFVNIEQIVNDFNKEAGILINGVRLYFIIKPKTQKGRSKVTGMLVPTKGPRRRNPEGIYDDMVVRATLKGSRNDVSSARVSTASASSDEEYVSIYDFTRPCPPYCDPESPVNG